MNKNPIKCNFCNLSANLEYIDSNKNIMHVYCPNCGKYKINGDVYDDLTLRFLKESDKLLEQFIYSGYLRENYERKLETPIITNENLLSIVEVGRIPKDLLEKINKLLLYLNIKTKYFGEKVEIKYIETAVAYAKNIQELKSLVDALQDLNYVMRFHTDQVVSVKLTANGLQKISEIQSRQINSKQCFVAMWFNDEMNKIYDSYISPAIKESGFNPLVIREKEHNNDIGFEIIAEIKKSHFMVADFTGQRGGVYFEAGFAQGLGLSIIWTCRDDWFNKEILKKEMVKINEEKVEAEFTEYRKTHFDIEHFSFIIWHNGEELKKNLKSKILATIN